MFPGTVLCTVRCHPEGGNLSVLKLADSLSMIAARLANRRHGGDRKNQAANLLLDNVPPVTQAEAAEKLNVSERSVRDAHIVLNSGSAEMIEAVESGNEPVSAAANRIRADEKKT